MTRRLAIVATHPVQYYSPWYAHLAARGDLDVRVFYLWDFGVRETRDRQFGASFQWDVDLLAGHDHEFVPNTAPDPGTHRFGGLRNPELRARVAAWRPGAVLMLGYNYDSMARLLIRGVGAPMILRGDSHLLGPKARGAKARAKAVLRRALLARFDAALSVGAANREYLRANGFREDRIFHAPHCIDNDRFAAARPRAEEDARAWRAELGIPANAFVVLFAGKLIPKKRPLDLLSAFRRLTGVDARLLFVGSGELEEPLRAQASGDPRVVFAPFQNQSAMPRTLAAGDCIVLPSHGRSETWGLIVNEAACLGRPAIVSSHVGCGPDLVRPGETGWIFEAGSIDGLQRALAEAAGDPARTRTMGERMRDLVVEDYSYAKAADGLLEALEALAKR